MPGEQAEYDLIRILDAQADSKQDTFFIAPKEIGRDGSGVQAVTFGQAGEPESPVTDAVVMFLDSDNTLRTKSTDGTVKTVGADASGANIQGCRVTLDTSQTLPANSTTKIQFDNKIYDSGNNFDTNTHVWTCPQDGLYSVNLQGGFDDANAGADRDVLIGESQDAFPTGEGAAETARDTRKDTQLSASTVNQYTAGDTIAGYAITSRSNDTLFGGNTNTLCFLEVAFLGGL
jgi:hypothetical protein